MRMRFKTLAVIAFLLGMLLPANGRTATPGDGNDVFVPIAKYLTQGNYEALSAWFADNLELSVISRSADASRSQSKQILKAFFEAYTPRSFNITHTAGRANMKYLIGDLNAGGENFMVTIFVICQDDSYKIQQIKIDRL